MSQLSFSEKGILFSRRNVLSFVIVLSVFWHWPTYTPIFCPQHIFRWLLKIIERKQNNMAKQEKPLTTVPTEHQTEQLSEKDKLTKKNTLISTKVRWAIPVPGFKIIARKDAVNGVDKTALTCRCCPSVIPRQFPHGAEKESVCFGEGACSDCETLHWNSVLPCHRRKQQQEELRWCPRREHLH